jgi:DNA-binding transcriptional LysR family regulator
MLILDHLDKLKIFCAVATRGTINGAAKELALSQPAITRAIQTLEHAAGYTLFIRTRNGMHLTDGGRILFATGPRVLKEISDATMRGAHAQQRMAGKLTIGTYETLAEYLWPDFLLKVQNEFPFLDLSIKTNSQDGHLADLRSGILDLLVDAEPRISTGLTLWPLYTDRFSFYSQKKVELVPDSARHFSLLSVRGVFDEDNITLEQHLSQNGYRFQKEYIFDSFTTVKRMATKGLGIAILPRRLADREANLHLLHAKGLKEGFGIHTIYATVSPHRENDRRLKALVSLLKKQLAAS